MHLSRRPLEVLKQAFKSALGRLVYVCVPRHQDEKTDGEDGGCPRAGPPDERTLIGAGGRKLRPHDLVPHLPHHVVPHRRGAHVAELCLNHQEKETMRRVYDGHDYTAEMAGRSGPCWRTSSGDPRRRRTSRF